MAAEEIDGTFGDGLDREDFEKLPCSWTYVVVCIFMPSLTGQLNVILTPAYTLHYEEMGWPLTRAGAAFSIGCGSRALVQQIVLRAGYWIAVPLCMVHLAIVILALIYTTSEWAVCAQLVVVWGIDPACAIEGIAFDCFGASEAQARQASSTSLSMSTISIAVSCTIGGLIYDATGWTGVTAYHCALEGLLVLLLSLQPACRKSFMEVFFPKKDPEVEAAEDQTETSGEMVFKQVVPGQAQAVQLPGATEELHLEEVEDENAKKASSMCRRQVSKENDQDDQSEPDQKATSSARISIISQSPARAHRRGSNRASLKSNNSAHRRASGRSARASIQSRQSDHTEQSARTGFTAFTRGSAFTAITKMMALSRAGEDFRHHFGTSTSVLPQIVGATGQKSVMRLQLEDEDEDEHGIAKQSSVKAGMSAIPKDVKFPAFLLMLCAFCNNTVYAMEFATYAILFKKVHNWNEATLAGIAQTAGDLTAAIAMQVIPVLIQTEYNPDEASCLRRFFHNLISEPYNLSIGLATWVIFHIGLCCPVLALAIVAQVFMGTTYVYASKWISDMNTFYSMGDSTVFLSIQVVCRNAEALGGAVAGIISVWLFTLDPLAPFFFAAALSGLIFLIYTVGFCSRLGFGDDIETAEQKRARRKGLRRVSSWAVDTRKSEMSSASAESRRSGEGGGQAQKQADFESPAKIAELGQVNSR